VRARAVGFLQIPRGRACLEQEDGGRRVPRTARLTPPRGTPRRRRQIDAERDGCGERIGLRQEGRLNEGSQEPSPRRDDRQQRRRRPTRARSACDEPVGRRAPRSRREAQPGGR
jgi:hypothetical protein